MRIFIIDDDEQSLFLTETLLLLKDSSLRIRTFQTGAEALEAVAAAIIPDIILLDIEMPVLDGWDFLEALEPLKQKLSDSNCNIYILTSCISDFNKVKAEQYPLVSGFIPKPIHSEYINHMLAHSINK